VIGCETITPAAGSLCFEAIYIIYILMISEIFRVKALEIPPFMDVP
jgi:hypothetical protein